MIISKELYLLLLSLFPDFQKIKALSNRRSVFQFHARLAPHSKRMVFREEKKKKKIEKK
jgi:hypothetical protein